MRTLSDRLSSKGFTRLERDGYLLEASPAKLMEALLIRKMCKRAPKLSSCSILEKSRQAPRQWRLN
jgi:hypothetical protein